MPGRIAYACGMESSPHPHRLRRRILLGLFLAFDTLFAVALVAFLLRTPSHDRTWIDDHLRLPSASITGNTATITNIRDFSYAADGTPTIRYADRTIDLSAVEGVDFIVSHFSDTWGVAHAFLSFRIAGGEPLAISIEARRERGEEYSPFLGLFRKFEEIYVVGTERDLLALRTHVRDEDVYLYPGVTTPDRARALLVHMLDRANAIAAEPQFYNTLTSQCTNELARHVDAVSAKRIPFSWKLLFPGYADELAYDLGFLDTSRPFADVRAGALLDPSRTSIDDPNYSRAIRGEVVADAAG